MIALYLVAILAFAAGEADFSASPHAVQRSVGLTESRWTRGFWAERTDLLTGVTTPAIWDAMQVRGNAAWFRNFQIAAGVAQGSFKGARWSDGDVLKWLEGAALAYSITRDPELDRRMDEVIRVIARAQAPDGYLSTNIQLTEKERWKQKGDHEMYNMGHLLAAAAIHYRATGKTDLLAVARRTADYLYALFSPRPAGLAHFGAPSNLMGIVEFYRATRDPRYLDLAQIFVDMHGSASDGSDNTQDRIPLRLETEAAGHAMHATYLYATAADVYAETGERALLDAVSRLWRSVTEHKMYVTGAVGPLFQGVSPHGDIIGEAFGRDFELPDREGYNETCANVGNALWNRRMLAITGDAKYADILELELYNALLAGMGLDARSFFYMNVHRRFGDELPALLHESRQRWHNTTEPGACPSFCCPPNLLRTLLKTSAWAYGVSDDAVWINLYGSGTLKTGTVSLEQETDYPWDGRITISIRQAPRNALSLRLRIPGWSNSAVLRLNGKVLTVDLHPGTYAEIRRQWSTGDVLELNLPMRATLVEANPMLETARNQVAVKRGPLVYCLESPDLAPGVRVDEIYLPPSVRLEHKWEPRLLGGVMVMEGAGHRRPQHKWSGELYRDFRPAAAEIVPIRLIPYYAWANRGVSHMTVWMPLGE